MNTGSFKLVLTNDISTLRSTKLHNKMILRLRCVTLGEETQVQANI